MRINFIKYFITKYGQLLIYFLTLLGLVYLSVKQKLFNQVFSLEISVYFFSFFYLFVLFFLSGIQLRIIILKSKNIKFSFVDTLMIPISQNFWGYVIPFQGSLLYSIAIFKNKYQIKAMDTIYIYAAITLFSFWTGGFFYFFYNLYLEKYLVAFFFIPFAIIPVVCFFVFKIFNVTFYKNRFFRLIKLNALNFQKTLNSLIEDKSLILKIFITEILFVFTYASYSYYLSEYFEFGVSYFVWLFWAFFLKITLLIRLTPGNLGITQGYTVALLAIYGYPAEFGIQISLVQLFLNIILYFPVALINSLFNLKYFLKNRFSE